MSSANRNRALGAVLGLVVWLAVAGSAGATIRSWINPAGGAATNTANWSPAGVPVPSDDDLFEETGAFTTSWASPADSIGQMTVSIGCNPSFTIANRLGITGNLFIDGVSTLTIGSGVLWVAYIIGGSSDAGDLVVNGRASEVDAGEAVMGSTGGASRLDVVNGGRFLCRGNLELGLPSGRQFAGSIHHPVYAIPAGAYYPVIYTLPNNGSNPECAIGVQGSATLDVYDGGSLNTIGPLFIGKESGGSGVLHCYRGGGIPSGVTSNGETWIGGNDLNLPGGSGTLALEGSLSYFTGLCHLGSTADAPSGPVTKLLQLDNSAYTVLAGGLTMTPALTSRFDVIGGDTHVIGGPVTIQQASPFELGSAGSHTPVLWLENGAASDFWPAAGAPALGIGRGGVGALYLAGTGTAATVHGALVMADSTGGNATLVADSSSTLTVQGPLTLGGPGSGYLTVKSPSGVLTVQDSTIVGAAGGTGSGMILADSMGTAHLLGHTMVGSGTLGSMLCYSGGHIDAAGLTLGPALGLLDVDSGSAVTVSDHFDASGQGQIIVEYGGVVSYTNAAHGSTFGTPFGDTHNSILDVNNGGLVKFAGELDEYGQIIMYPSDSAGLLSPPTGSPPARRTHPAGAARVQIPNPVIGGRIECPLVRLRGAGHITATGTIAGRLHIESGTATLQVSYNDAYFVGHGIVGDSTKTDGFVSVGATTIGRDTLKVLDSDGGDLGKMTIAGGDLQLPMPGHLKSGFLLSGNGTVDGSLDVQDSAWVSFSGSVTGDVALAGTLDTGPSVAALLVGTMHDAATGVTTLKLGHTQQDLIVTSGYSVLGGTLDLRTLQGDTPQVGDTLAVMVGAPFLGSFANVTVNGHSAAGQVAVLVNPGVWVAVVGAVTGVGETPPAGAGSPAELRFAGMGGPREAALGLDLPAAATVRVALYDVTGRQVAVLADGELGRGRHRFELTRMGLGSGMYFARAVVAGTGGARVLATRVVVLR